MNRPIPFAFCEATAREEGWLRIEEVRIGDLRGLEHDVVYDMVFSGTPQFFNVEQQEPANATDWEALCAQQCITVHDDTFRIPDDLSDEGKQLARKLRQWVVNREGDERLLRYANYRAGGIIRAPEFQGRFERTEVPETAVMALVFDGGPLAHLMNLSYEDYAGFDALVQWFNDQGYWCENVTHWWAWVMKND